MKVSIVTGLPLMNGVYSRMSLSQSLEMLQLFSHPAMDKPIMERLNEKDILLISGSQSKLNRHEQSIINLSSNIFNNADYRLHRLNLRDYKQYISNFRQDIKAKKDSTSCIAILEFEEGDYKGMFGTKASQIMSGSYDLFQMGLQDIKDSTKLELSLWTFVDDERGGMPFYHLIQYQNGKEMHREKIWASESFECSQSWVQTRFDIAKISVDSISLIGEHFNPYIIDNLMLRDKSIDHISREEDYINYNNFYIEN